MNFFEVLIDALLIDGFRGLEHLKIDAYRRGEMDKSLNVLGKTKAAESQSRLQKLSSDARIKTHRVSYFLDVSSDALAQIRDYVRVTDF